MKFPPININATKTLSINKFREMDYLSIEKYNIPIELMMENAGLNLARLTTSLVPMSAKILIGIGTGNNGGGGLVAARRLSGWGYKVYLHIPNEKLSPLPQLQLKRALAFGTQIQNLPNPDIFIDAYLGFSQRLPLSPSLLNSIQTLNDLTCKKISLDIPTGFNKETGELSFKPDIILTLAAMKTELLALSDQAQIFIADLGLPNSIYEEFGIEPLLEFRESGVLRCMF